MSDGKEFLGTGWSFPPTFEKGGTGSVTMISGEEDIRQSLQIIATTSVGERVMQPDFGAQLSDLLFESITQSTASLIEDRIRTAIFQFEPRVELNNVDVNIDDQTDGLILIDVDYTVSSTNTRKNIVFPFYLNEGTDI
ncbi:MAG TPA: GPW/gp25 family protein [Cytophagaceae bacterium]|jgi:phage baseplate assembly protein W|nr:GPW/gp25 family protein [Cytophagaceae bacterium]